MGSGACVPSTRTRRCQCSAGTCHVLSVCFDKIMSSQCEDQDGPEVFGASSPTRVDKQAVQHASSLQTYGAMRPRLVAIPSACCHCPWPAIEPCTYTPCDGVIWLTCMPRGTMGLHRECMLYDTLAGGAGRWLPADAIAAVFAEASCEDTSKLLASRPKGVQPAFRRGWYTLLCAKGAKVCHHQCPY